MGLALTQPLRFPRKRPDVCCPGELWSSAPNEGLKFWDTHVGAVGHLGSYSHRVWGKPRVYPEADRTAGLEVEGWVSE